MKYLMIATALVLGSATVSAAEGPLGGISKNLSKNGAFSSTDYGATSKSSGEPGDVSISGAAIGVDNARGGENASPNSVVTTTVDTGGESGTRVSLPD